MNYEIILEWEVEDIYNNPYIFSIVRQPRGWNLEETGCIDTIKLFDVTKQLPHVISAFYTYSEKEKSRAKFYSNEKYGGILPFLLYLQEVNERQAYLFTAGQNMGANHKGMIMTTLSTNRRFVIKWKYLEEIIQQLREQELLQALIRR